jgi:DUF1680 family protein
MNSDEQLLRMTGDGMWADNAEDVAFNSYPAALMPDFRSLRYLTSPNMVLNDGKNHAPGINNSGPFLMMNPFSSRCCQHNHSQGWPYFCENLWQATSDGGAAAVLYAASDATLKVGEGVPVRLSLRSNYPFEDTLRLRVGLRSTTQFPLYLRVPAWCDNPSVLVNGVSTPIALGATLDNSDRRYIRIVREWSNGDTVQLKLPMKVSVRKWEKNHDSVSVDYGPLTFSLKIGENYVKKEGTEFLQEDSHFQKGVDKSAWPAYEIYPTTPWNYGLLPNAEFKVERKAWPTSNFPFTQADCPISISTTGRKIPEWKLDQFGLCGVLKDSPAKSSEKDEAIELIPMGAARLRISAFPTVDSDGVQW